MLTIEVLVSGLSCSPWSDEVVDVTLDTTEDVQLDDDGVDFPTSGDALIVVNEQGDDAVGSAVCYEVDDGETVDEFLEVFRTQI